MAGCSAARERGRQTLTQFDSHPPAPLQPSPVRRANPQAAARYSRFGVILLVTAVLSLVYGNIVSGQAAEIDERNSSSERAWSRVQDDCPEPTTVEEAAEVRSCDIARADALNAEAEGTTRSDALRGRATLLNLAAFVSAAGGVFLLWRARRLRKQ